MTPIEACRACGSPQLTQVLDLGLLALSDFVTEDQEVEYAPLEVVRCEGCTLVQLRHTVPRERLYRHYYYRSGVQEAMVAALRDVAEDAMSRVTLEPGDVVLDIGANDGTLLRMFPKDCIRIGFEPALNLHTAAMGDNKIIPGFFPEVVGDRVVGVTTPAKIITSIAMFYDVDNLDQFIQGIKLWLHPDGVWVNQLAYLPATLLSNNVGDFCHEHLTYWTNYALLNLLARHDLEIRDQSYNTTNGGSVRYVIGHRREGSLTLYDGLHRDHFGQFARRVEQNKQQTIRFLQQCQEYGKTALGYGASTKGNTLLQYYGIDQSLLPAIADRNPDKHGKRTAGSGIPVIGEEEARSMNPDYFFVLPHHFIESFKQRERAFLERGGRFVIPLPTLHTVGLEHADDTAQVA